MSFWEAVTRSAGQEMCCLL